MKKTFLLFLVSWSLVTVAVYGDALQKRDACLTTAFTAGYVFKQDCIFKEVYGHGLVNIITADACYYPWELWGLGAKVSYWRAHGRTTFLKQCSFLHEVPLTFYVRRITDFMCGLQAYASLGGGLVWIKEKSYLGKVRQHAGIGEVEFGLSYPLWRCIDITGALRYLFPRRSEWGQKVEVGGLDLRAGIGFSF